MHQTCFAIRKNGRFSTRLLNRKKKTKDFVLLCIIFSFVLPRQVFKSSEIQIHFRFVLQVESTVQHKRTTTTKISLSNVHFRSGSKVYRVFVRNLQTRDESGKGRLSTIQRRGKYWFRVPRATRVTNNISPWSRATECRSIFVIYLTRFPSFTTGGRVLKLGVPRGIEIYLTKVIADVRYAAFDSPDNATRLHNFSDRSRTRR